jgi:FMN-dependent NADH-azoreductase
VEVVHHSFPLSSSFPADETFSVRDALLRRHGMGASQAEASARGGYGPGVPKHGMDHLVPALETVLGEPANLGLTVTTVTPELTMAPHVLAPAPLLPLHEASLTDAHAQARGLARVIGGRPAT